jgi:hypothetical protein
MQHFLRGDRQGFTHLMRTEDCMTRHLGLERLRDVKVVPGISFLTVEEQLSEKSSKAM